jgi:predicted nucleotidyltransferase
MPTVAGAKPSLETIIAQLQQKLPELQATYDVEQIAVFGSYARHEQREDSDLDLLVRFRVTPGLLRYIALEQHLADMLGLPVDLVMESAVRPEIAQRICADRIRLAV